MLLIKVLTGYEVALYEFLVTTFVQRGSSMFYSALPYTYEKAIQQQYYKEVIDEKTCSAYPNIQFTKNDSYKQFLTRVKGLNTGLPNKEYMRMVCEVQSLEKVDRKHFQNVRGKILYI